MLMHRSGVAALIVALAGCAPAVHSTTPAVDAGPAATLHALLDGAAPFGFSGAVLAARGGDVIFRGGYGAADRERGVPITPRTAFSIGSVTKQFTAAAILKLEEQGRLSTTDSIGRFLGEVPADKRGITLHHLLTHTSGLDFSANEDVAVGRDVLIANALASELAFAPGEAWGYSNGAFSVLAAIVELASGMTYEGYLREHLLLPAGMHRTGYVLPQWAAADVAHGYHQGRSVGLPMNAPGWSDDGPSWNLVGSGGLISTVEDLHRWHVALAAATVLSEASVRRMTAQQAPLPENPLGWTGYGYGWILAETPDGRPIVMHNGSNRIFYSDFRRYPADDMVLIVLTNTQDEANFSDENIVMMHNSQLEAVLFGAVPAAAPAATTLAPHVSVEGHAGTYKLPSGARFDVAAHGRGVRVVAVGQEAVDLLAGAPAPEWAVAERNAQAERVLAGLAAGSDSSTVAAADARLRRTLLRTVEAGVQRSGALRGYEVLGTVPVWWSPEDEWATFVRLDYENGSRISRLHWSPQGQLSGLGGAAIPAPVSLVFLPQSATRFVTYHPTLPGRPELEFRTGPGGSGELRVRLGSREGVARREASQ